VNNNEYLEHLQELLLADLDPSGVGNITQRTYDVRQAEGNSDVKLSGAQLSYPQYLTATFHSASTFGSTTQSTATGEFLGSDGTYSTTIRLENVGNVIPDTFDTLPPDQRVQTLRAAYDQCDIKVHCSCPAFMMTGMWEDLASVDGAAVRFQGTKGTGHWRNIYAAAGGLKNSKVRICKHIKQVLDDLDTLIPDIASHI
jgi:hypothetical protein